MIFNQARNKDFHPRFLRNGNELEMTEETKILGLILRTDLSWKSNTELVKRASKKLWCFRRLKNFGADTEDLLEVYLKQIRCLLEYAVAVWQPSLTYESESRKLQRCGT